MALVNVKIDGRDYAVESGSTILEACRAAHINIPTLCYYKKINAIGACRICLVEVKGARSLVASCVQPVSEGMEIRTNSPAVIKARKINLELILSDHNIQCLDCLRNQNCDLQKYSLEYGVQNQHAFDGERVEYELDESTPYLVRDNNKCILCRRCSAVCAKSQGCGVIGANDRGFDTHIGCAFEQSLMDVACIGCGQCVVACPTGALTERDQVDEIFAELAKPDKHVFISAAPSVRTQIAECFGNPPGTDGEGKMVAAMKRLNFEGVFDLNFTADLTIIEEATELMDRIKNGGKLPLITSCSPGWIKYCEHYHPDMIENLSTCKSPQQMFGAVMKTYFAEKNGWDPKDIVFVSCIPCTAKKFEVRRPDQCAAGEGIYDVDYALTTRELGRMIKRAGIDFNNLPEETFDSPFAIGKGSGAGVIFGATGGVMEAALRTASEWIMGKPLEKIDFEDVRGVDSDIKVAAYKLGDLEIKVAVTSGTANANKLLNMIKSGELDVQFVEIMACPGGCVNGGGQPIQPASITNYVDLRKIRAKVLYDADKNMPYRKSHENPQIKQIYDEFFGEAGSHKAHEILHTSYVKRDRY